MTGHRAWEIGSARSSSAGQPEGVPGHGSARAGAPASVSAQAPAEPGEPVAVPRFSFAVSGGVANGSYPFSPMSSGGGYHIGVTGAATARAHAARRGADPYA
jgi:hypothetical protein